MISAPDCDWTYLADTVMGGISKGRATLESVGGETAIHLTGTVSTANRGGFIQARTALPDGLPSGTQALVLRVRGNGQRYFIHLRTTNTGRPWHYFQCGFTTGGDWADVTLHLSEFQPAGRMPVKDFRSEEIVSLGLVAYGRDHQADVALAGFSPV